MQALVAEQPALMDAIEREVMLISKPTPPTQITTSCRRTTLDVGPFQRQVKHLLRESVRSLEEGYEDDPLSDQLLEIMAKASAFARNDDGNSATAILTAITARQRVC